MSHPTLYNRILQLIDEQLDRLFRARAILIDYANDAKTPEPGKPKSRRKREPRQTVATEAPVPEVQVTVLPPAPERRRRPRAVKSPQPEPHALASRIPSSPVAVAPAKDVQPKD